MMLHDLSSTMLRKLGYVLEIIGVEQTENEYWLASMQNKVRTRNPSQKAKSRASENSIMTGFCNTREKRSSVKVQGSFL